MNAVKNPYVFAVGCPRSGTTLLQRMLDNHPRLAVANDTHFIPKFIKEASVGEDPPLTEELVEEVRGYRRFYRLGVSDEAVHRAAERSGTYGEFVGALYSEFAGKSGKSLGGEKTPDYVRDLPKLHALFPWVKTVHIIRDGRDVALSTLKWANENKGPGRLDLWNEEPVAVCALWWRRQVEAGMKDGRKLGARSCHEVKYEDLVAEPEERLREISDFLDLTYAPEMARFHEGKTRDEPGLDAKRAWLPPTQGLRNWRSAMSGRDLELFEALAGDLLSNLGYERGAESLSQETVETAARCREWWEKERARRREKHARRGRI
ncbi:MAG: sulfotransferase family protein [Rubrobacteraceae bacterium]